MEITFYQTYTASQKANLDIDEEEFYAELMANCASNYGNEAAAPMNLEEAIRLVKNPESSEFADRPIVADGYETWGELAKRVLWSFADDEYDKFYDYAYGDVSDDGYEVND